jgi:hypothetical protein
MKNFSIPQPFIFIYLSIKVLFSYVFPDKNIGSWNCYSPWKFAHKEDNNLVTICKDGGRVYLCSSSPSCGGGLNDICLFRYDPPGWICTMNPSQAGNCTCPENI